MPPLTSAPPSQSAQKTERLLRKAAAHQENGSLGEAERIYQRLLEADPTDAGANYRLGLLVSKAGEPNRAVPYLSAALKAQPRQPQYWLALATALLRASRLPDARAILQRFIEQGFAGPEIDVIRDSLVEALFTEASEHYQAKRLKEAEALFETIIMLDQNHVESIHIAGNIACTQGRFEQAYYLITTAISMKADVAAYRANLGNVFWGLGKLDEAFRCYKEAFDLNPDVAEFNNNLGVVSGRQGHIHEAIDYFHRALELDPNYVSGYSNLGVLLKDIGRVPEAIACYDKALSLDPGVAFVHSNRLFAKMYAPEVSPYEQFLDAKSFGERFADPLQRHRPFANDKDAERKLRLGFVSADFRHHAVNYFFEPIISELDRGAFETFAYSQTLVEDHVTARLKLEFDHWRCIRPLDDESAADLIEQDGIDILVDLSGHTAGNRLLVFARKPAPVQVTWIGYPGTTGVKAIDYRFTDPVTDPEGPVDDLHVEKLWRLPDVCVCYQADPKSPAVIDHPPSDDNGYLTFGSFNRFAKVADPVLEAWSKILARIPDARLLLEIGSIDNPAFRAETEARFERLGLPLDRVIFEPRRQGNQYVLYNRTDIALDPFPYNGGTTSMDSLWMGVPFVALEGNHYVSRMGAMILTVAGLPELVARSVDEYVAIATDLASDRERLRSVRRDLRERMAASPHMDHKLLCRNVENAFRSMWRRWVESGKDQSLSSAKS